MARVNDGALLWVGDQLLIDQDDNTVVEDGTTKAAATTGVTQAIAAVDALTLSFAAPLDDGVAAVDRFLVDWWTTGMPETQVVKLASTITGGSFTLTLTGATTGPIAYNALPMDVEVALQAIPTFLSRTTATLPQPSACAPRASTDSPGPVITCTTTDSVASTVSALGSSRRGAGRPIHVHHHVAWRKQPRRRRPSTLATVGHVATRAFRCKSRPTRRPGEHGATDRAGKRRPAGTCSSSVTRRSPTTPRWSQPT